MTIFNVTTETWHDPDFWAMVTTAPGSNALDFSALPDSFTISFARDGAFLSVSDGTGDSGRRYLALPGRVTISWRRY